MAYKLIQQVGATASQLPKQPSADFLLHLVRRLKFGDRLRAASVQGLLLQLGAYRLQPLQSQDSRPKDPIGLTLRSRHRTIDLRQRWSLREIY